MIPMPAAGARRALVNLMSTVAIASFAGGSVAVVAAACGPAEPEARAPIDADAYVVVMSELADLERFPPPGSDEMTREARADSARLEILERRGVTVDGLLEFAETVGEDPHRMVELVGRISVITDSLARERTGGRRGLDTAATPDLDLDLDLDLDVGAAADDDPAGVTADTLLMRERLRNLRELRDEERTPAP